MCLFGLSKFRFDAGLVAFGCWSVGLLVGRIECSQIWRARKPRPFRASGGIAASPFEPRQSPARSKLTISLNCDILDI